MGSQPTFLKTLMQRKRQTDGCFAELNSTTIGLLCHSPNYFKMCKLTNCMRLENQHSANKVEDDAYRNNLIYFLIE